LKDGASLNILEDGSTICSGMLNPLDLDGQQAKAVTSYDNNFDPPADHTPLAIVKQRSAILDMLKRENVIIIKGFTGCGKTTQVPQFILDECYPRKTTCNIVVTQPRRIAAINIAKRVCQGRNLALGTVVGYIVNLTLNLNVYKLYSNIYLFVLGWNGKAVE
jgi:HrpA-like RNA helicase